MPLSDKHFEFEKGYVEGIPTLSCFNPDKKTGPRPLVILSHAFQSSKEFWQDKLEFLAASGYFAVAMDNKGHGERNGPDKLCFIQEDNSGHDFTESMWQNVTKWFQKHL